MITGFVTILVLSLLTFAAPVRAAPPDSDFEPWFTSDGVEVRQAPDPGAWPWVQAIVTLPVPSGRVMAVATDFPRYQSIFSPYVASVRVLERNHAGAAVYMEWQMPFPFRNRDASLRYDMQATPTGGWMVHWQDEAKVEESPAVVRVGSLEGIARIEPLGAESTRVVYTGRVDLRLGNWLNEKVARYQPLTYFTALRAALSGEAEEVSRR